MKKHGTLRSLRVTAASRTRQTAWHRCQSFQHESIWSTRPYSKASRTADPREKELGRIIEDEYAIFREIYETPKHPIILAHGLMGFDELHLAGKNMPGIQYWRGITEALRARGTEIITASVPASGSIAARAEKLGESIEEKAAGRSVNIIAHRVMIGYFQIYANATDTPKRGLDSRYLISRLKPNFKILSLTTIATPHRGSAFADFVLNQIGPTQLPKVYKILNFVGIESDAFSQLTSKYMIETFNPRTPDADGVKYYSYGATNNPSLFSVFRQSHRIVAAVEGANDGLVSVASSKWGKYMGTLQGVSHLDLINWTNRIRWLIWTMTGNKRNFNALAFYLDIAGVYFFTNTISQFKAMPNSE